MSDSKAPPEAMEAPKKKPAGRNKYAMTCAILASMTSTLLGYDVAVISGAALFIKEELHVSDTQLEILAGIINLYALIGSFAAGRISDWIGRRYTIIMSAGIFFAGALVMGLAPSYAVLMVGRFVAGIGVGFALMIAPVYTAEVAPASIRGLLTSLAEVFINGGILIGPRVFEKAGIKNHSNTLGVTVAVGFSKTAFILVATFLLDRVGRRPLLLASGGGMIISLLGLGMGLTAIDRHPGEKLTWAVVLSITAVLTFVGSFSIGLGPIAWVYCSEIFPLRFRAQGNSLGASMNRAMSGTISMTFLSLSKAITTGGAFFLYCGVATAGWLFFYFFLPETRGKTLEEVEVLFTKEYYSDRAGNQKLGHGPAAAASSGEVQLQNGAAAEKLAPHE